jgi:intermediate filament protein if
MREIQACYDEKMDAMRNELEGHYNLKMQEYRTGATRTSMEVTHIKDENKRLKAQLGDLRAKLADMEARNAMLEKELELLRREYSEKEREWETENTELKNEVAKLRAEMEAILKELQDIMDTKLGLELEIAAYRKLLEGEENRIGLRNVVDSWASSGRIETTEDSSLKVSQVVKGEMSAKTTYQRSAKGPVSISECSADGKFVSVENTGRKAESLGGWQITRNIDGSSKVPFTFEPDFQIRAGGKVKIWAGGRGAGAGRDDLETSEGSWGIGANITTKLVNPNGEDRATHVQKTIYTSSN